MSFKKNISRAFLVAGLLSVTACAGGASSLGSPVLKAPLPEPLRDADGKFSLKSTSLAEIEGLGLNDLYRAKASVDDRDWDIVLFPTKTTPKPKISLFYPDSKKPLYEGVFDSKHGVLRGVNIKEETLDWHVRGLCAQPALLEDEKLHLFFIAWHELMHAHDYLEKERQHKEGILGFLPRSVTDYELVYSDLKTFKAEHVADLGAAFFLLTNVRDQKKAVQYVERFSDFRRAMPRGVDHQTSHALDALLYRKELWQDKKPVSSREAMLAARDFLDKEVNVLQHYHYVKDEAVRSKKEKSLTDEQMKARARLCLVR